MLPTLDLARPEPSSSEDNSARRVRPRRRRDGRWIMGSAVVCLLLGVWVGSLVLAPSSATDMNREGPILVIGDSLVMQATTALRSWNLPSVPILADGGLGSAPCDWEQGYTDPLTGKYLKFSEVFHKVRPAAVVFAFTGNPGLDSRSTGCVNSSGHYALSTLLASYKRALTDMARYASAHGAQVFISASPPRNPATPEGVYRGSGGTIEYGFNGVPALNRLYEQMARSAPGDTLHWTYDPDPAEAVSSPTLRWHLKERCLPWDDGECATGTVQVRAGGRDAIHLDTSGAGAILYAIGLVQMPLADMNGWSSLPPLALVLGRTDIVNISRESTPDPPDVVHVHSSQASSKRSARR